ncbi:MAG: gliding motility-associated C-terminal domain-containing protein [Bacteroidales bacterium]
MKKNFTLHILVLVFILLISGLGNAQPLRVNSMPSNHINEREGNAIICQPIIIWGSAFGGTPPYTYTLYVDGIPVAIDDYITNPQAYGYGHYAGRLHTFLQLGPRKVRVEAFDAAGNFGWSESTVMVYDNPIPPIKVAMRIDKALLFLYKTALNDVSSSKNIYWSCAVPGHFDCYSYAATASAVLAYEEAGHFDLNNPYIDAYADLVKKGLHYTLTKYAGQRTITNHPDGAHGTPVSDNFQGGGPGGNAGAGKGTYLFNIGSENIYANTIGLMAVAISRHSAAEAMSSVVEDGALNGWTFYDVMKDALDLLYWDQGDFTLRGGWRYWQQNNPDSYDGSVQQWPTLVMKAARDLWGIQSPLWVLENTDYAYQQHLSNLTGGVGYLHQLDRRNVGKTGGFLIFWDLFPDYITQATKDLALDYIVDNYLACGPDQLEVDGNPGWAGSTYQMYALMKGLTVQNINLLDVPGLGVRDWYRDMVAWLTAEQIYELPAGMCNNPTYLNLLKNYGQAPDGSWSGDVCMKCDYLATAFAVLILLRTVTYLPPISVIDPPLCTSIIVGCDTLPPPINNCMPLDSSFSISGLMSYHMGSPNYNIVNYYWAVDPPTNFDWSTATITGPHPFLPPFSVPGPHTVCLRVEDNHNPSLFDIECIEFFVCAPDIVPAPIAKAIPDYLSPCYTVQKDVQIILDGHESYIPSNCDTALYWWDIDGDNIYDTIVVGSPFLPVTYHENGEYRVGLIIMCIHDGDTVMSCSDYACLSVSSNDLLVTYFATPCVHENQDSLTLTITFLNDPQSENSHHYVNVNLYNGNPLSTGVFTGNTFTIMDFAPSESETWTVTIANQWNYDSIWVWIDPYMMVAEWNETNNLDMVWVNLFGQKDIVYINEDQDTIIDVLANDVPWPFPHPIQVGLAGFPQHGFALPMLPNGYPLYYLPNLNYSGIDSVPYILRIFNLNGNAYCEDTVWVIIHILPVNDSPYLNLPDIEMCQNEDKSISLAEYQVFHDLDNTLDQITFSHHFLTNSPDTALVNIVYTAPELHFTTGFNDNIERTFDLVITAIDSAGALDSDTITINIYSYPKIILSDTAYCAGNSVILNAGNPGSDFVWSNGQTTQSIPVGEPGTYAVTVTNPGGCSNADTATVVEKPVPVIQLSNEASVVCEGDEFTLHAYSPTLPGPVTFVWFPGGYIGPNYTGTAINSAYYYVIGSLQGCQVKDSILVEVNSNPEIEFNSDVFTICPSENLIVQVTEDPECSPATFLWNTGSTSSLLVTTPTAPGYYVVTVTCYTGCWSKDSVQVFFSTQPFIEPMPPQSICIGDTISYKPNISPPSIANLCEYQWSNGLSGPTLVANPKFLTTYTLTVTYQVCSTSSSVMVDVLPVPDVNLPEYVWLETGESEILDAGPGLSSYNWSNGFTNRYITVTDTGKYWVTVRNMVCENADTTYVYADPNIFVPNAFTPNNDGTNDVFYAFSAADLKIKMWIFNRWGELIFESDDLYKGWDGKYKGDPAPVDVYTWVLEYIYTTPGPYFFEKDGKKKGMVVLIR